ncbi:DNA repair protein RecN [Anaerobacillus sp. MEB173]|uniref:DNA repair protein RecN n=1 Tax=Anaerobacillus sp. MEB173 TaxID=3383345 RepID=UPI003F909B09
MLVELSIKDFAIIDELSISFEKGLTVLTGETGAGKSIIIDAIGLLIGGRGSSEFVRFGAKRAEIEGLFSIENNHSSLKKLEQLGIEIEDSMLILRRDITESGKSVCRINGKLVTLAIIREIGSHLVDIHGQHEHQHLMAQERHLAMLDLFGKEEITKALKEYKTLYERYIQTSKQLKQLSENEQEITHRLDLIQYQLNEIEKAKLEPNEDEQLFAEKMKLANSEKIYKVVQDSYHALYGEGKGMDWITLAMNQLEDAVDLDKELQAIHETVTQCFYLLEEATFSLSHYVDSIEFDPDRLNLIESRLNEINGLKRKYGTTVTEILEYAAQIEDELDTLVNKDDRIQKLQKQLEELAIDLLLEAKNLSSHRQKVATRLKEAVLKELKELYMEKTVFEIAFNKILSDRNGTIVDGEHIHFYEDGIDKVEFLLSANPGEPLKPLSKVASGGEISRIMLALKAIFSVDQGVTSLIFDEVDTGVSGRVAQAIAEKIFKVSSCSQVLCITHLPQVAAMADTHLYIAKKEQNNRVVTSVAPLTLGEKIDELARMISGVEVTEITRKHAEELLQLASAIKQKTPIPEKLTK